MSSAYRSGVSYTPWSKSNATSSTNTGGSTSSYGGGGAGSSTKDTTQYERRYGGGSGGYRSSLGRDSSSDRKYGSSLDGTRDLSASRTSSFSESGDRKYGTYPHRPSRADGPPVTMPPVSSGRRSRDPSPEVSSGSGSGSLRLLTGRPPYSRSVSRESPGSRYSSATLPRSPDDTKAPNYSSYSARSRIEDRSPYLSSKSDDRPSSYTSHLSNKSEDRPSSYTNHLSSKADDRPSTFSSHLSTKNDGGGSNYSSYLSSKQDDRPSSYSSRFPNKVEERTSSYSNHLSSKPEERTYTSSLTRSRAPYINSSGSTFVGVNHIQPRTRPEEAKADKTVTTKEEVKKAEAESSSSEETESDSEEEEAGGGGGSSQTVFVTVVARGTSPTPPSSSHFLRSRRAEVARVLERTVARPRQRPATQDKAIQSDRGDDTARSSRFAGTSRPSPWTSYLDRYSSSRYSSPSSSTRVGGYSLGSASPRSTTATATTPSATSEATRSTSSPSVTESPATSGTGPTAASAPATPTAGLTRAISFKTMPRSGSTAADATKTSDLSAKSKSPSTSSMTSERTPPPSPKSATAPESKWSTTPDTSVASKPSHPEPKSEPSTKSKSSSASSLTDKPPTKSGTAKSPSVSSLASKQSEDVAGPKTSSEVAKPPVPPPPPPPSPPKTRSNSASSVTDTAPSSKSPSASSLTSETSRKPPPGPGLARSKTTAAALNDKEPGKPPPLPPPEPPPSSGVLSRSKSSKLPPSGPAARVNKDFRKSALNMDLEAAANKRRLRSGSDGSLPPATTPAPGGLPASSSAPKLLQRASGTESESTSSSSSSETESSEETSSSESDDEEQSAAADKPKEEAKSFLMRALAPVTNFFRGSGSEGRIRHVESGERAWWLDPAAEVPEGVLRMRSSAKIAAADGEGVAGAPEGLTRTASSKKISDGLKRAPSSKKISDGIQRAPSSKKISDGLQRAPSSKKISDGLQRAPSSHRFRIRPQQSGELPWWLKKDAEVPEGVIKLETSSSDEEEEEEKSADKPVEDGRRSPYDNVPETQGQTTAPRRRGSRGFIGSHTNIDDILGSVASLVEPAMGVARLRRRQAGVPEDEEDGDEMDAAVTTASTVRRRSQPTDVHPGGRDGMIKLDDAALQLYKDGDYGAYLDLDASINEQQDEFENFHKNHKNSIVLRTQLSVRVHTIIEKLLNSEGRELRRALFSLKQIFQEDKDLVHEFVQNDGLACLIKVGSEADQNYQNYILRALGQVMLYVDGMNGVMEHNQTVQWLYTLIASKFRLVVKTALKLLLVFVEYVETNCLLLIRAIHTIDAAHGVLPWSNIIKLLKDFDTADTELLIYATTLINKTLNGIPDQDTYYDQVDALEEQGIEAVIQRYMSKQGTDLDLLRQFQIYEAVLHHEDGEEKGTPLKQLDEAIRKTLRQRKALTDSMPTAGRRKSRRHSTGTSPFSSRQQQQQQSISNRHLLSPDDDNSSSSQSSTGPGDAPHIENNYKERNGDAGVTPALRRRRERAERQRSFIREQQETTASLRASLAAHESQKGGSTNREPDSPTRTPDSPKRECGSVRDLTQRLASAGVVGTQEEAPRPPDLTGDMTGLVSRAKEGLAKSKSKAEVAPAARPAPEVKKSEVDLQWEELVNKVKRPLSLADLDFTDLATDDEIDILSPSPVCNGGPPPPPPVPRGTGGPPPPPVPRYGGPPPPPPAVTLPTFRNSFTRPTSTSPTSAPSPIRKTKKTVKLFWKEVRDDPVVVVKLHNSGGTIWDELPSVSVDTQKLEHLFESRAKDIIAKEKQQEMNKNKEVIVLDHKRSNAINIGMTKLPPPRSIRTAIMKMDATIMNREGIEKLLTMLPTEEECAKIQEAQMANPDLPLGSAEQFLLTLASISELPARLKLWAFKLDYENSEKEIAEPLMDLKQGIETLKGNKTFRAILSTLLSIGIFLNGSEVKGFQIEYLAKVPEVKDTVHKHSLLHHLCHMVMEKFPDSTDLYSEIGAVTRASKVDFDELAANIQKMEQECKASWDHLKVIAKHDGSTMKAKMSDFLADCAERIIVLGIVHRRVMNRFHKFLLWLGIPLHRVQDLRPNEFCRTVSEFALEYRTTRERVLQQLEKKASHRERNKTRGKMITEVGKFRSKEDRADAELRQLLGGDTSDAESIHGTMTLPWRRQRKDIVRNALSPQTCDGSVNGHLTDGDDEILESLVKTATKAPSSRTTPRERKRTRNADRKSLRRTLKNGLSEEDKKHLAAYIKGY